MSLLSQFYTGGAEPSYFPAPDPVRKFGPRSLGQAMAGPVMISLIVAIAMMVVGMGLLWEAPEDNPARAGVAGPRPTPPQVRLVTGTQEPPPETARLVLHSNPQLQKIILDTPLLLPPFPTEHNVTIGTPSALFVRTFGKPDLSVRTMQQERIIETYIYEQQDRATLVMIQDGSVVSARTGQAERTRVLPSEPEPFN